MKTANRRHLITEALALSLGYDVDGKTGHVDGVDLFTVFAEVTVKDVAATRRVGLGAAAGVAGVASFGVLGAPLALLGLKKRDNRTVTITLYSGADGAATQPRTFTGKQFEKALKFAERVNAQK